jgi:hypothetical protein
MDSSSVSGNLNEREMCANGISDISCSAIGKGFIHKAVTRAGSVAEYATPAADRTLARRAADTL